MLSVAPATWNYWPRLLLTVAFVRIVNLDRAAVVAPLIAFYLTAMLLVRNTNFMWLLVGWIAIDAALFIAVRSRGPRYVFYALIGILVLHALAIPGSILWGGGDWVLTAFVLLWMIPNIFMYLADVRENVLSWMAPSWLIHTALILYQGMTNWHWATITDGVVGSDGLTTNTYVGDVLVREANPAGLANNPNIAAGFLLLGIVYMSMHPRLKWLTPPMFIALMFTGSRWGLLVCGVVVLAMLVSRRIDWKPLAATFFVGGVFLLGFFYFTPFPVEVAGYDSFQGAVHGVPAQIGSRLAFPHIPSLLPHGVAEHPGLHNVSLRQSIEIGLQGAALWLGVSLWALWKNRNGPAWWMLLTVMLLGQLDYYVIEGQLPFWWLLIGLLVKRRRVENA